MNLYSCLRCRIVFAFIIRPPMDWGCPVCGNTGTVPVQPPKQEGDRT